MTNTILLATEKAPAMLGNVALLKPAIENYNSILATKLAAFKKGRSITAKIVDTHRAFNEALNNPAKYGSPDATCYNGDGKSCVSGPRLTGSHVLSRLADKSPALVQRLPPGCADPEAGRRPGCKDVWRGILQVRQQQPVLIQDASVAFGLETKKKGGLQGGLAYLHVIQSHESVSLPANSRPSSLD